ncbi:HPr family phosphocarrier protein [Zhaonella formicivorans]|uniref:HPr family phosphocarrier protein n=1 Tax=Zhaonella formicivorans TaxID=2528593 RepID=UPI0010E73568|nr:HPr family phosphocarrier protein [Zhaonella formicivorans]
MQEKLFTIRNEIGLHARPAALMVKMAQQYQSEIWLEKNGKRINAKSITAIMQLAAKYLDEVKLIAQGADEEDALKALTELVENKFGEA